MTVPPARDLVRAARAIEEFLDAIGAPRSTDPELASTPERVADAFANDLLAGYAMDPAEILSEATGSRARGLVVLTDVAATAICPHHLLPASGVVHVGYLPGERVVGLGALGRLVDCFARRLVLQEDLARAVAEALALHLGARGAGVVVDLVPTCVTARGERRHGARAIATAFTGIMQTDASARTEMLLAIAASRGGAPGAIPSEPSIARGTTIR